MKKILNAIDSVRRQLVCNQRVLEELRDKIGATKTFFLCDGEVPTCKKRDCYKNGGECRHTLDANHAINFKRRNERAAYMEVQSDDNAQDDVMV